MSREEVYAFIKIVNEIKAALKDGVPLSQYPPREIADAIGSLIASAVVEERSACAQIAEDSAGGSGTFARGRPMGADASQRDVALRIAELIRSRKS
jgi:hypothetical protein